MTDLIDHNTLDSNINNSNINNPNINNSNINNSNINNSNIIDQNIIDQNIIDQNIIDPNINDKIINSYVQDMVATGGKKNNNIIRNDEIIECPICMEVIKEKDKVTLKCNHVFHYNCILATLKNDMKGQSHYYKKKNRNKCPYCRSTIGYLPLQEGTIPIKDIHKEYNDILKGTNIDKYLVKGVCCAILKTGKNAGMQCKRKLYNGSKYCKIHYKSNENN